MLTHLQLLILSTWQTLYMVITAGVLAVFCGLCLGLLLLITGKNGVWQKPWLYRILSLIVNIGRSIPFVILMIALIPFTRLLVGTSIGTNASIVPLTIAAIPFFARIAESAFKQVDPGLIEAAHAMGIRPWPLIYKVILPESLVTLLEGATLTVVSLVAYTGIVGVMGGGGLGDVAIRYGYQRFDIPMMIYTIIILVVMVQLLQWMGDFSSKRRTMRGWGLLVIIFSIAYSSWIYHSEESSVVSGPVIVVGITSGPQEQIMQTATQVAKNQYGITLKLVVFSDYVMPNQALASGQLDANIFQHIPYLNTQIAQHGWALTPIGKTFVYPLGFYSIKIKSINALPNNALIAIPNDPSNEGRALLLLAQSHLITLNPSAGLLATPNDITRNPKHLQFKELDAADISRALPDVTMGALTNDYVAAAHFNVNQALIKEGPNAPYANVIVVVDRRKDDPLLQKLVLIMHSKPVLDETLSLFPNGAAIPAWPVNA
ncbi:MAG: MetQ/NlpA family ABC transporter substrate-binding protein [Gammaproteobacteria bacterium]|nr:MetQ/NlpA family ABC transporter substrate-binding protein [Gammaproteobacteria bacterium]